MHHRSIRGEEKETQPKKIFEEIIGENLLYLRKEIVTQIQEAHRVPYRINPKRNMLRHIVIKMTKKYREIIKSNK